MYKSNYLYDYSVDSNERVVATVLGSSDICVAYVVSEPLSLQCAKRSELQRDLNLLLALSSILSRRIRWTTVLVTLSCVRSSGVSWLCGNGRCVPDRRLTVRTSR